MKAAVLSQYGTNPKYDDYNDPIPTEGQVVIQVKAASVKQIDKSKASGRHYTGYAQMPAVVGIDGAGLLPDGTAIYAWGITGMMAEKALVAQDKWTLIPQGISLNMAAALPNALVGADIALQYRGQFKPGQTILINGATGATGKIAVQMARNRGAARVIATGRNEVILNELLTLGADEIIVLTESDDAIVSQVEAIYKATPIDIIIDYLWGNPAALILQALGKVVSRPIKFITVGEMAGGTVNLPSSLLRSKPIELLGSGIGSVPMADIQRYLTEELPLAYAMAVEGKLVMDLQTYPLSAIEAAWGLTEDAGKRIVINI